MISLTIIAHGNGLAAFRRHLPLWQAHDASHHLVLCPEDDPLPSTESPWPIHLLAKAQHNGRESLARLKWLLQRLSTLDVTHHLILEYDSFSLAPRLTPQHGFIGNVYGNRYPARFLAPRYANPPWIVDSASLIRMYSKSLKYPDLFEEGEADRWFSALAWLAGVPILPHSPPGYSRGWIDERYIAELRAAIYRGSTMLHGIKQKWTLEAALQFYDERPKQPPTAASPAPVDLLPDTADQFP